MADVARTRRALSFRVVAAGLIASLAFVALAAGWAYFRYLRYERVGARHLPPDTTAAARIDVEQIVLFAPIRKHLIPLIDELRIAGAAGLPPRLQRIEKETGINLALELRELIFTRGPGSADWALILAGRFPDDGIIAGVDRVLRAEGTVWRLSNDGRALVAPSGIALGQAEDGTLVLASNAARLAQALPPSQTYATLGLDPEGPGGFASDGRILTEAAAAFRSFGLPVAPSMDGVQHVRGSLALGTIVQVDVRLDLRAGVDAERLASELRGAFGALAAASAFFPGTDYAGERAALAKARVAAAGPNRVTVTIPWPREDLERGAASLAAVIRDWVGTGRL